MSRVGEYLKKVYKDHFGMEVSLQNRLFYIAFAAGILSSLLSFLAAVVNRLPKPAIYASLSCLLIMILLSLFVAKSKNIWISKVAVCGALNFILFPATFFASGGIDSGMPFFFLLGLYIATIILEKKTRLIFLIAAVSLDLFSIMLSVEYPQLVVAVEDSAAEKDILSSFVIIALFMMAMTGLVVRQYTLEHDKVQRLNRDLEIQSVTDSLTGIFNRRYMIQFLGLALEQYRKGDLVSVAMFDMDDFKMINDTYGHICGDKVLIRIAEIFNENVPENGMVARYGGEEIIIVAVGEDGDSLYRIADGLRKKMMEDPVLISLAGTVTVSGGVTQYKPPMGIEDVLKEADDRLYRAKKLGKNRIVW